MNSFNSTLNGQWSQDAFERGQAGAIERETGLDPDSALLLWKYRVGARHHLFNEQILYVEALEKKLAQQKADRALAGAADASTFEAACRAADVAAMSNVVPFRPATPTPTPEPPPVVPTPLPRISMATWDTDPVPEQDWAVHNRIPRQQCVLFSGEGSAGKSTTQLHLSVAHVLGRDWLGTMPEQGPAIFVDAEDDAKVMHRRLAAITQHYGVTFKQLIEGGLHLVSLAGHDAVLATVSRGGKLEPTPRYRQIEDMVGDVKPVMIGLASSANFYAGSEIDRAQVQQFISLMTRLAVRANGSVVLISHPSLTGIATDTGLSGNTQWHNAVRARFYMKSVKADAGEQTDNDLREIVFKKSNYGPLSESIVLRYKDGLFLPVAGATSLDKVAQEAKADEVFLDLLRRFTDKNRTVSDKTGTAYAPALFAREEEAKRAGLTSKALEAAMRRLFAADKIWNKPHKENTTRPSYRLAIK